MRYNPLSGTVHTTKANSRFGAIGDARFMLSSCLSPGKITLSSASHFLQYKSFDMLRFLNWSTLAGVVCTLLSAHAWAADGACGAPVGKDFLAATPSEVNLSASRLSEMMDALDASRHEVRALLILKDCQLALESYKTGIGREYNHAVWSVTKSFSSTLVGALMHQGKLKTLDAPIAESVPKPGRLDDASWEKAKQITLRNVMQMSSGLEYKHDPCCHPIYDTRQDRLVVALTPALVATPGTRFLYSDGDVSMTGAVIASVAGTDLLKFATKTLFTPLQMSHYDWSFKDWADRYPGGWGLRVRPMDMMKLGQLYVQKGVWNGSRIFDAEYVDEIAKPGPNKAYGLHWWMGDAAFAGTPYYYANGFKGQRIFVFPAWHLVVTLVASVPGSDERSLIGIVVRGVIDAYKKGADSDANGDSVLQAKVKSGFHGVIKVEQQGQDAPQRD